MVAIVLIGVMVDRPTLTFRTLTVAALGVLLLAPEAIVHPSFQMSFAATLALVAGYQQGLPWMSAGGDSPLAARIALWGGRARRAVPVEDPVTSRRCRSHRRRDRADDRGAAAGRADRRRWQRRRRARVRRPAVRAAVRQRRVRGA